MNRRLVLLCIAIAACGACRYDPNYYTYLRRELPPAEEICGTWVVDFDGTTWRNARSVSERALADGQRPHLEIYQDERFDIEGLADFSFWPPGKAPLLESASGTWRTQFDNMNDLWYLWLEFDKVNGASVTDKSASILFRREGQEYLLHVTIGDPDSGEAVLMRKMKE